MKNSKPDFIFTLLLFIAMVLWGGSWAVGKIISNRIDASVIVFWRLQFAFIGLCGILLFNRFVFGKKTDLRIDRKTFLFLVLSAVLMTLYNQLFFRGLSTGLSGAGGVLVTTTNPLFTYILWIIFFKKQLKPGAVAGLVLGLGGGLILLEIWQISPDSLLLSGNLFFIIASIIWALLTIISQETQKSIDFLTYCFYLYGFSSLFGLGFAIPGNVLVVFTQDSVFWISIFYLSIPTTSLATTIYFYASKKLGSHRASSFIFIVPVAAMLSSFFIHGEIPSVFTLIGGLLAIGAVYIINRYKSAADKVKE